MASGSPFALTWVRHSEIANLSTPFLLYEPPFLCPSLTHLDADAADDDDAAAADDDDAADDAADADADAKAKKDEDDQSAKTKTQNAK